MYDDNAAPPLSAREFEQFWRRLRAVFVRDDTRFPMVFEVLERLQALHIHS